MSEVQRLPVEQGFRRCKGCGATKPLDEYYKHPTSAGGRRATCKPCLRTKAREYHVANRVARAERGAAWRAKNPEKVARSARKWYANNRQKWLAHRRVRYAIETGRLVREPCECCGAVPVHAHHDDYSKPLEVRWLCPRCHKAEHARLDDESIEEEGSE